MNKQALLTVAVMSLSCGTSVGNQPGGPDDPGQHGDSGSPGGADLATPQTTPTDSLRSKLKNGSRLKWKMIKGADGSQLYVPYAMYDSQRKEECSFRPAADGQQRCLPNNKAFSLAAYFYDANCTQSAIYNISCVPAAYVGKVDSCGVGESITPIQQISTPSMVYIKDAAGKCTGQANPFVGSYLHYRESGPTISPTEFVAGTIEVAAD